MILIILYCIYNYAEISANATLRASLAKFSQNANATNFGLQHFTYSNVEFLDLVFENIDQLRFQGIIVQKIIANHV